MTEVRNSISNFPGDPQLILDPTLRDGALSRVGGMVVLSPRFLSLMDEQDGVRDVLLAHELSHLYKRHSLKALQYEMINSVQGWNIAKKLLRNSISKASNTALPSAISGLIQNTKALVETSQTVKDLVEFMQQTQVRYSVEQEFEADACAVRWLQTLNIEPAEAWRAFAGVLQDPGPNKDTSYISLHPSPAARSENIAKAISAQTNAGRPSVPSDRKAGKPKATGGN